MSHRASILALLAILIATSTLRAQSPDLLRGFVL